MSRYLIAFLGLTCVACAPEERGLLTSDIVSYRITLKSPQELGSEQEPLAEENPHPITVDVEALGADGQIRADYSGDLKLWVFFQGTLSPALDENGSAVVSLVAGGAYDVTRTLPVAFGPTTVWVEDVRRLDDGTLDCLGPYPPVGGGPDHCSYATGSSPVIHYRNPYLDEVQQPLDPTSSTATFQSLLMGKSVLVDHPRDPDGLLVVTGAYAQAFTVSDVSPSAVALGYNHIYVYSYSRAKRNDSTAVMAGDIVASCDASGCRGYLTGGVKEFVGFTELDFPLYDVSPPAPDAPECRCGLSFRADGSACESKVWAPCVEPVKVDPAWLQGLGAPNDQDLERLEAGLVSVENALVCPFDEADWTTYGQFTVDIGSGCRLAVASKGVVPGLDPVAAQGQTLRTIIGTLRNVSDYSSSGPPSTYSFWILYPRAAEDVDCGDASAGCAQ